MIERELHPSRATGRYVLRPQRSATWRQDLWLLAAIAGAALPLAIGWSLLGFWVILPICVFQLMVVLAAFYANSHGLLAREVVTIDEDRIVIEAGRRRRERRFELPRAWAQVRLWRGRGPLSPSRLIIRAHGQAVECGRFLTDEEREALSVDLRAVIDRRP